MPRFIEVNPNPCSNAELKAYILDNERFQGLSIHNAQGNPLYINFDEILSVEDALLASCTYRIVYKNGKTQKLYWPWNIAFMLEFKKLVKQ